MSLPRHLSGDIPGHDGFLWDKAAVLMKSIKRETLCNDSGPKKVQYDAEISNYKLFVAC